MLLLVVVVFYFFWWWVGNQNELITPPLQYHAVKIKICYVILFYVSENSLNMIYTMQFLTGSLF